MVDKQAPARKLWFLAAGTSIAACKKRISGRTAAGGGGGLKLC